jgi:ABC-2 type transport system permease protein
VLYGLVRTSIVLVVLVLMFHLSANQDGLLPAAAIVAVGSLSFVGIGIMAATLPAVYRKGAQMTYVIEAVLLLISGVYFKIEVLPGWLQVVSYISPATYVLRGTRAVLIGHATGTVMLQTLIPLAIIGIVTIPMGVWVFSRAEHFAKRTGRLKRTG